MAKRRNQIAGQFVSRPRQLVESPAMRVLSLAAHQALMRIEIEHMSHAGKENGKLPVTYRQLEEWGVRRHSVASGVRELVALGIIEITRRGYSGAADMRAPNLYRLTYLQAWNAKDTGTHEYLKIGSVEQAEAIAATARKGADPRNVERGKKNFATPQIVQKPPPKTWGQTANSRPPKRGVHVHPPIRGVLSISRDITPARCGAGILAGEARPVSLTPVAGSLVLADALPSPSPTDPSARPDLEMSWLPWRKPAAAVGHRAPSFIAL